MWAALEDYDLAREWQSHEVHPKLPVEMGTIHAFGACLTAAKDPEFFDFEGPYAVCGMHVKVRLAIPFPEEPDDDVCTTCAQRVAQGATGPPGRGDAYAYSECQAVVQPNMEGLPHAVACVKRNHHDPPHRSSDGHIWVDGPKDFTPSRYSS